MSSNNPTQLVELLSKFSGDDLTRTLSSIETSVRGLRATGYEDFLVNAGATREALAAAARLKRIAGQINVAIHALGILLCLPHILNPDEEVEYISLGAGNTGREFDLETSHRVAEFKFIHWRGGPEFIRQNSVFKDFFLLAESEIAKAKYLYVLGTEHPLKFLNGGRALTSVLSKDERIRDRFYALFQDRYLRVRDYYQPRRDLGCFRMAPRTCFRSHSRLTRVRSALVLPVVAVGTPEEVAAYRAVSHPGLRPPARGQDEARRNRRSELLHYPGLNRR